VEHRLIFNASGEQLLLDHAGPEFFVLVTPHAAHCR